MILSRVQIEKSLFKNGKFQRVGKLFKKEKTRID
jgi:hypothetical protein